MDAILNSGIAWIVALHSLGEWLVAPMKFFSFLGTEEFFMLILPALYWCVDAGIGLRVGIILLTSSGLNDALKMAFHGPRPYWFSTQVKAYAAETSFGVPSGHAQTAAGVWGMLAASLRKWWAWIIAALIILLIGISRVYLGVHFPHDVILGWLIGGLLLWLILRLWDPVTAWLKKRTLGQQILLAFAASMLLLLLSLPGFLWLQTSGWQVPTDWSENAAAAFPDPEDWPSPVTLDGALTSAGTLFGLAAGVAWLARQGGFSAAGPGWKRVVRYLLGLVGVLILWYGLGKILPRGAAILPYLLRYLRYALVGAWVAAGAPALFTRLKLVEKGP